MRQTFFSDVVAISASHRDNANTEAMLRACASELQKQNIRVRIIRLRKLKFKPCDGCVGCNEKNGCHIDDEMTALHPCLFKARAWIVATPEYWWNVSGHCKDFLDRLNAYWKARATHFAGKKAAILTCGAQPLERTGYAEKALETFFTKMHMDIVGSVRASAENPGEIRTQARLLTACRTLGKKLALELKKPSARSLPRTRSTP